jgi:ABC-type nitrate/sulfonate/bicarbonate transport system substrate-binding protein
MLPAISALPAIAAGADLKLVASGARFTRPEQLPYIVVLKDSPIKTIKDLDGRTISGHMKGSNPWSWVQVAMKEHGIEFSQYIGAPAAETLSMLIAGTVDSAIMWPVARFTKFKGRIRHILPLNAAAKFGGSGYWFSGQFLQEHSEAVRGFIAALQQARDYERDHPLEVLLITDEYTFHTFEELKTLLEANALNLFPSEVLVEVWQLEYAQGVIVDLGILDEPLDINKLVDTRFAKPVWEMPEGELDWLP